jgi:hypothetical protein
LGVVVELEPVEVPVAVEAEGFVVVRLVEEFGAIDDIEVGVVALELPEKLGVEPGAPIRPTRLPSGVFWTE